MGKLLQIWLDLIEEKEKPGMKYITTALEIFQKRYEKDRDCINMMRAFNEASLYNLPIPAWVINGLDSDNRFQKYRP